MATQDSKTKAFSTTAKSKRKSIKNKKRIRQQIVISIFVVVALILVVFATLIIGQIINKSTEPTTPPPTSNENVTYIPRDAGNVKMGDLVLINKNHPFDYIKNNLVATSYGELPQGIVNLWAFKNNSANNAETKINIPNSNIYAPTYELASATLANQICLEENTLHKFNQMMLDYCKTLDLSSYTSGSASKINVAWGWSYEDDLNVDLDKYGDSFATQANGKSITLKQVKAGNEQVTLTEKILKNDFYWIYANAHNYGFIVSYPDSCSNHYNITPEKDGSVRVHLRYVGVSHATYIYQNNICLDEYLDLIRTRYTFDSPLVINTFDGKTYNVYYVAYSGNPTSVPVPKDSVHTISGDNMNGFIVTVEK